MLQAIRSRAGSLIVKILFAFLIISFGIWGIGDIFRTRQNEIVIANVGGIKVRAEEVQTALRQETERLRQMFGGALDAEQLKQLDLVDGVVDRIVTRDLFDLESDRLKLLVGDEAIRNAIVGNPAFQGSSGGFDRTIYNRVLANNRLSEPQYEAELRRDIVRSQLSDAVGAGAAAPPPLVEALYRSRNEKRTAETVMLPLDTVAAPAEVPDAELSQYYEKHQDAFRVPEQRGFTLVALRPEDIAKRIEVPDAKLQEEYQARSAEFVTPEKRQLDQMLLGDEAKAKQAEDELKAGKDFLAVAKEVAGQEADAVHLGWVEKGEMPPTVGDAAFQLGEGQTSEPLHGPFGWAIVRVIGIQPGKTEPFEAVRDKLAAQVARDQATDQVFELSNEADDALAGGATVEDVATKFSLPLVKVDAADPDGRTPDGKAVDLPAPAAEVMHDVFNTAQGQTTRLTETHDRQSFYVLRVDTVTPSAVKPLDAVKDKVAEMWKTEKRHEALDAKAKELAAKVGGDKTLDAVAKEAGLTASPTQPFSKSGAEAGIPPALAARLFAAKPGEVVTVADATGAWIGQLKDVEQPEAKPGEQGYDQLAKQLRDGMRNDLLAEYDRALRGRYPVEIHQDELHRLF
jgi:peptidyl-prolyl cis-trans isomerase D